jgi:hypothetical protein
MDKKQISNDQKLFDEKNRVTTEREIYTDKEASAYLRISQVTLWRERTKGNISFRRVSSKIVYLREDLENYLNRNKREAFGAGATR